VKIHGDVVFFSYSKHYPNSKFADPLQYFQPSSPEGGALINNEVHIISVIDNSDLIM
jgi:hypothetical protein